MRDAVRVNRKKTDLSNTTNPSLVLPNASTLVSPIRSFTPHSNTSAIQNVPEVSSYTKSTSEEILEPKALKQKPLGHDISQISLRPQAKLTIGRSGDKYEQEADQVAAQVVKQINTREVAPVIESGAVQKTGKQDIVQMVKEKDFIKDPNQFLNENVILFEYIKGFLKKYPKTYAALNGAIPDNNLGANLKLLMRSNKDSMSFSLEDSGEKADEKSIYYTTPAIGLLEQNQIKDLFKSGGKFLVNADNLVKTLISEERGDYIRANYVPYLTGNPNETPDGGKDENSWSNVGSAVIDIDPEVTNFVFTDAMNGCAYAITEVEGNKTKFEAWHFQSESDNWKQASHFRATKEIRDWFSVNDYYIGDGTTNLAATNIIWHDGKNQWKMLSQKNIVPLNTSDKTTFLESTSHDLNVSDKISEEKLAETHDKLIRGTKKDILKDIEDANNFFENLSLSETKMKQSTDIIKSDKTKMTPEEATEINRISGDVEGIKASLDQDSICWSFFEELSKFQTKLTNITVTNILGLISSYDTSKTKPLKIAFVTQSQLLYESIKELVESLKKEYIDDNENSLLDESVISTLENIRAYFDIYKDMDNYRNINNQILRIQRINRSKIKIAERGKEFQREKETLFPKN